MYVHDGYPLEWRRGGTFLVCPLRSNFWKPPSFLPSTSFPCLAFTSPFPYSQNVSPEIRWWWVGSDRTVKKVVDKSNPAVGGCCCCCSWRNPTLLLGHSTLSFSPHPHLVLLFFSQIRFPNWFRWNHHWACELRTLHFLVLPSLSVKLTLPFPFFLLLFLIYDLPCW